MGVSDGSYLCVEPESSDAMFEEFINYSELRNEVYIIGGVEIKVLAICGYVQELLRRWTWYRLCHADADHVFIVLSNVSRKGLSLSIRVMLVFYITSKFAQSDCLANF